MLILYYFFFFFSSRRRHTRCSRDWSSDVCSSDLEPDLATRAPRTGAGQAAARPHARRILPRAVRGGGTIDSVSSTSRRTHRCGELRLQHVGQPVRLGGWVHRRRDLGGIVFIDLRDRAGIVQVAAGPGAPDEVRRVAGGLTSETVVEVEGEVTARPANMKNPELATGDVEGQATKLAVVGPAGRPPRPVARGKGEERPAP